MSLERDVINITMYNTYDVLMGNITEEEILLGKEFGAVMTIKEDTIKMMIRYFEGLEEYEMCAELMKKL